MGVIYSHEHLSLKGQLLLYKLGLQDLGTFIGFWPSKKTVQQYKSKGCDFTVYNVNDEFQMKLYVDAGFKAIGTDDLSLLVPMAHVGK